MKPLLETALLSSISSSLWKIIAPDPQGSPGLPEHEPSVNATAELNGWFFSKSRIIIFPASSCLFCPWFWTAKPKVSPVVWWMDDWYYALIFILWFYTVNIDIFYCFHIFCLLVHFPSCDICLSGSSISFHTSKFLLIGMVFLHELILPNCNFFSSQIYW